MKIMIVVGTRPNVIKAAPVIRELEKHKDIEYMIIHTGQHYDFNMSDIFFSELNIPEPEVSLNVGSDTHARQTSIIMQRFESILDYERSDIVMVFGDVNSTLACSLVVSKIDGVELAHVEAGCRSFDRRMPEEINRVVTDHLSDYLFCATSKDKKNLINEGIDKKKIFLVGNVMLDNLFYNLQSSYDFKEQGDYALVTIHRASNTDEKKNLKKILTILNVISKDIKVIFPIHPRTKKQVNLFKLTKLLDNVNVIDPLGFIEFSHYLKNAKFVLTDSGGIQVETSALGIPCITLRKNTEWDYTLTEGTNILTGLNKDKILQVIESFKTKKYFKQNEQNKASEKIVSILKKST